MKNHRFPAILVPAPRATVRRLTFVSALWLAALAGAPAAMVPGAEPKEWPANPEKHQVTIRRVAGNETEAKMIAAAEAAYPAKAEVLAAAKPEAVPRGDKLWWNKEELGIKIPYALTAEAVAYFKGLVEGYGKQALKRYIQPRSQLSYEASARFHKDYEHGGKTYHGVHVVTLKMSFSEDFTATMTEGLMFRKERVVILDGEGKVLRIEGDGDTETPIVAI